MNKFSYFENGIRQIVPNKIMDVKETAEMIRSDSALMRKTSELRKIIEEKAQKKFKESFPNVTFSGIFYYRDGKGLQEQSGYLCIDLDHIGAITAIRDIAKQIQEYYTPALMFISPRGSGLKVVFRIDIAAGTHLQYFAACRTFFKTEFHLAIDEACKNIDRVCFLCHDLDVFFSNTPDILNHDFISKATITDHTEKIPVDVPDETSCYENLKEWTENKVTFLEGNRNLYITTLAGACNRFGLSEQFTIRQLEHFAEDGFDVKEINAIIKSVYRNTQWHGITNTLTDLSETPIIKEEPQPTPLLPIEGLPQTLQDIINECSNVYGTHRDLWAGAILAATCLALGRNYKLKTKYINSATLWIALVAKTGVGKTEPFRFAFKPFHNLDAESIRNYEIEKDNFDRIRRMDKKKRESEGITENPEMPICKQYLLSDATPESMYYVHNYNPRGICMERDELKGWIDDFGRYNKSGEEATWIQSWSEQPITINRKSDTPMKIMEPFMCVAGGMQPEALAALAAENRDMNGFMQRFCFVYPDKADRPHFNKEKIRYIHIENYNRYINNLLEINNTKTGYITLSPDAEDLYIHSDNKNTDYMNAQEDGYILGMRAKLPIITLRLALVIHFCHWAVTGIDCPDITKETMQAAIDMAEYFRITGEKVASELSKNAINRYNKKDVAEYLNFEIGWTQSDIAKILKVSKQYVNKIARKWKVNQSTGQPGG
jgi:hypothetical protein